jgi:hypothetical protein
MKTLDQGQSFKILRADLLDLLAISILADSNIALRHDIHPCFA